MATAIDHTTPTYWHALLTEEWLLCFDPDSDFEVLFGHFWSTHVLPVLAPDTAVVQSVWSPTRTLDAAAWLFDHPHEVRRRAAQILDALGRAGLDVMDTMLSGVYSRTVAEMCYRFSRLVGLAAADDAATADAVRSNTINMAFALALPAVAAATQHGNR